MVPESGPDQNFNFLNVQKFFQCSIFTMRLVKISTQLFSDQQLLSTDFSVSYLRGILQFSKHFKKKSCGMICPHPCSFLFSRVLAPEFQFWSLYIYKPIFVPIPVNIENYDYTLIQAILIHHNKVPSIFLPFHICNLLYFTGSIISNIFTAFFLHAHVFSVLT